MSLFLRSILPEGYQPLSGLLNADCQCYITDNPSVVQVQEDAQLEMGSEFSWKLSSYAALPHVHAASTTAHSPSYAITASSASHGVNFEGDSAPTKTRLWPEASLATSNKQPTFSGGQAALGASFPSCHPFQQHTVWDNPQCQAHAPDANTYLHTRLC